MCVVLSVFFMAWKPREIACKKKGGRRDKNIRNQFTRKEQSNGVVDFFLRFVFYMYIIRLERHIGFIFGGGGGRGRFGWYCQKEGVLRKAF